MFEFHLLFFLIGAFKAFFIASPKGIFILTGSSLAKTKLLVEGILLFTGFLE
jgi:hypothetical protein